MRFFRQPSADWRVASQAFFFRARYWLGSRFFWKGLGLCLATVLFIVYAIYIFTAGAVIETPLGDPRTSAQAGLAQAAQRHAEAGPGFFGFLGWHWTAAGLRVGDPPYSGSAAMESLWAWGSLAVSGFVLVSLSLLLADLLRRALKTNAQLDPKKTKIEERIAQLRGEEFARKERDDLSAALQESGSKNSAAPAARPARRVRRV